VHVVDIAILKVESRLPSLCLTKGYSFSVSCSLEKRFSHPFSFSFVLIGWGHHIFGNLLPPGSPSFQNKFIQVKGLEFTVVKGLEHGSLPSFLVD
jgi:hypothetical protein